MLELIIALSAVSEGLSINGGGRQWMAPIEAEPRGTRLSTWPSLTSGRGPHILQVNVFFGFVRSVCEKSIGIIGQHRSLTLAVSGEERGSEVRGWQRASPEWPMGTQRL